ncbi:MAG: serine/threonine protein kinase [Planctomycetes bacterium]|nr:serine/threonine protein kinase [Planctomycetota bacterium]
MTDPLDFERLRAVFLGAARLSGAERERFVQDACDDRPELAVEVRAMLRHHDAPPAVLAAPARDDAEGVCGVAHPDMPRRIGPYRVLDVVGTGGVGVVYRAEQYSPRRIVALKLLQPGAMRGETLARFAREAELLGRLQHPGIAQVIDAGTFASPYGPQPYFAMEFVDGLPLTRYAQQRELDVRARCRLIVQLCEAVQHAHDRGIVHRDLKPGNVLVAEPMPGAPQVKVLDFGIARCMAVEDGPATQLTHQGQLVGTLPYVSPEQLRGDGIDARTDVYALGAVLYELLVGRVPLDIDGQPLSRAVEIVSNRDPEPPGRSQPALAGDLDAIVCTALEKRPADRYPSAAALAADLRRYLDRQSVLARRPGPLDRVVKFSRRNRGLVAATLGSFVILAAAVVAVALQADRNRRLAAAEREARTVERRSRYFAEMSLAGTALEDGGLSRVAEFVAAWEPQSAGDLDVRGWEWSFLRRAADTAEMVLAAGGVQFDVGWLPDGRIAAKDEHGCSVWDLRTRACAASYAGRSSEFLDGRIAPDGSAVALSWDDSVRIHDLATGSLRTTLPVGAAAMGFAWNPTADRLALIDPTDQSLEVWDLDGGRETFHIHGDSGQVALGSGDLYARARIHGGIEVGHLADPGAARRLEDSDDTFLALRFAPGDHLLAAAGVDRTARVWDVGSARLIARIAHDNQVFTVAWSPDGSRLASAGRDQQVRVWDRSTGAVTVLRGHGNAVWGLAYSPDGDRLASASEDGTLRIWSAEPTPAVRSFDLGAHAGSDESPAWLCWTPADGLDVSLPGSPGSYRIDPDGSERHSARSVACWSADRSRFAYLQPGAVVVCGADGSEVRRCAIPAGVGGASTSNGGLALDARGERVAFACRGTDASVWIWAPFDDGAPFRAFAGWTNTFAWSPDGSRLALASDGVLIVDGRTGATCAHVDIPRSICVAWHPAGDRLAVADYRMRIHLCPASGAGERLVLRGHMRRVRALAWHPSGERLASAGNDDVVRLWDPRSGLEALTLRHDDDVFALAWRPDGLALASASSDGVVRIWDARAPEHR